MTSAAADDAVPDDRTTRARIRDAAIACFAETGVPATTVRTVANAAGVSPGLVIHHFGSKDGLRVACDRHVAAMIREAKREAVARGMGPGSDPLAQLRARDDAVPLLAYLARTVIDGTPEVAALIDEMVEDAVGYIGDAVEQGLMTPSDDPRGRAVVLTVWSLGGLVLHEHIGRLMGVDMLGPASGLVGYMLPAAEALSGSFAPGVYEQMRDQLAAFAGDADPAGRPGANGTTAAPGASAGADRPDEAPHEENGT
ncbi:MAG: TetR family transcriptional regulator [Actinomycetota bacterium]|nr:TetR family transcriptional regulator [Actinomycetota bacterium]